MTASLAELLRPTKVVLLDFDGPVCDLFAGYPARIIADELSAIVAEHGYPVSSTDPPTLHMKVAQLNDPILRRTIADALRDAEIVAAATAKPTPGVEEIIRAAHATGRRIAIVTNNAAEAAEAYLELHGLVEHVDLVVGRDVGMDPHLLKPNPHLVKLALNDLATDPDEAVFIGDSTTDVEAGRASKVPTIGYANKAGKRETLEGAGAAAVVEDLRDLVDPLQAAHEST
jgi:HAD superfamily hydrolase (TIGR01509 family)